MARNLVRKGGLGLGIVFGGVVALFSAAWLGVLPGADSVGGRVYGTVYERDIVVLRCRVSLFMSPVESVSWKQRGGDIAGRGCVFKFRAPSTDAPLRLTFDISASTWHGAPLRGTAHVVVRPRVRLAIAYTDLMGGFDLGFNHSLLIASHGKNRFSGEYRTLTYDPKTISARAGPCPGILGSSSSSSSACREMSGRQEGNFLVADVGLWTDSPDLPAETECVQQLTGDLRMPLHDVRRAMQAVAQANNGKVWRYSQRNSNSFAFSAAERLLGKRPTPKTSDCDGVLVSITTTDVPAWHLGVL